MREMTDSEFLWEMIEKYQIEDFQDVADMCSRLSRFARIAVEISKEYDNKYGEDNDSAMLKSADAFDKMADIFSKAYYDELV